MTGHVITLDHLRVVAIRSGAEIEGRQVRRGDVLTLPRAQAQALIHNGACEAYPEGKTDDDF